MGSMAFATEKVACRAILGVAIPRQPDMIGGMEMDRPARRERLASGNRGGTQGVHNARGGFADRRAQRAGSFVEAARVTD